MSISDILFSSEELNKINFSMDLEDSTTWINAKSKDITAGRDLTATFSANYSDIYEGEDLDSFSLNLNFTAYLDDLSSNCSIDTCLYNLCSNCSVGAYLDDLSSNCSIDTCLYNLCSNCSVGACFDDLSSDGSIVSCFDDLSFNCSISLCLDELCSNNSVGLCLDKLCSTTSIAFDDFCFNSSRGICFNELCSSDSMSVCLDELCSGGSGSVLDNLSLNQSITALNYPVEDISVEIKKYTFLTSSSTYFATDLGSLDYEVYSFEISFKGDNCLENSISAAEFVLGLSADLDLKLANFESFKTFGFKEGSVVLDCFDTFKINESSLCLESSKSLGKYRNNLNFSLCNDESEVLTNQSNSMDLRFTGVHLISFIDNTLSANVVDCSVINLLDVGTRNTENTSSFDSNIMSFNLEESLITKINSLQELTVNLNKSVIITEEVEI